MLNKQSSRKSNEGDKTKKKGNIYYINENSVNLNMANVLAKISGCDGLDYSVNKNAIIGNMQVSSNKGFKQSQGDAALIMQHPLLSKFKILAIADGKAEADNCEEMSSYLIEKIEKWFKNLPVKYYSSWDREIMIGLQNEISKISEELSKKYRRNKMSFVSAITRKNGTLIASVGNSIAYSYKSKRLQRISELDSQIYDLYEMGAFPNIKDEDDLRFYKSSKTTKNCIGFPGITPKLNFSLAPSNTTVILCSDGVNDCITFREMDGIIKNYKTSKKILAETLVTKATDGTWLRRPKYLEKHFNYEDIQRGKDNATVAILWNEDR